MSAVGRTLHLATAVDTLAAAWEFVMAHVDEVGPHPRVAISPYVGLEDNTTRFDVAVSGYTEESA